jgi:hypothetical protein
MYTIGNVVKVDICVAKTGPGDGITTDTDTGDGANAVEQLEEHGLGDAGVEFADIQAG